MKASQRALVGGMSILLPAAGIAYLGAVSYQEDRGIVADRLEEQSRAAEAVAATVHGQLERTLERVAESFAKAKASPMEGRLGPNELQNLVRSAPLARRPFMIARTGHLVFPARQPLLRSRDSQVAERSRVRPNRACTERSLASCLRSMRAAQRRERQLARARLRERSVCIEAACLWRSRPVLEVRQLYRAVSRFDDTGPAALLGLARLARAAGQLVDAAAFYHRLDEQFAHRVDDDGIPYRLLAAVGVAGVATSPDDALTLYADVLDRHYRAPAVALDVVARALRESIRVAELSPDQRRELRALDERLLAARREAALSALLAGDLDDISRIAGAAVSGRPARGQRGQTLVFRRLERGDVVGVVVDREQLNHVAADADIDLEGIARGSRATVVGVGETQPRRNSTRTLASASLGEALPHLTLRLINDRSQPDPLDDIVRKRGRRHLAITGGLAALLMLGLVATIRGAARQRELARLKSDFVTTVSHELKTPLTSIRMFAEMLQQDVAGEDRGRERRYHDIIVKESERLGLLIANLLDYSQIEKGIRRYSTRSERAGDVLNESIETFERIREGEVPHLVVTSTAAAADTMVEVDRSVVVQAMLNLLANAAKYAGGEGNIEVTLTQQEDHSIVFAVRDHGPGIPRSEQARVFKEFYRSPEAYSSGVEGTGLGLALVKRHVEAQGGIVKLDSAPGKGATFSLVFSKLT